MKDSRKSKNKDGEEVSLKKRIFGKLKEFFSEKFRVTQPPVEEFELTERPSLLSADSSSSSSSSEEYTPVIVQEPLQAPWIRWEALNRPYDHLVNMK